MLANYFNISFRKIALTFTHKKKPPLIHVIKFHFHEAFYQTSLFLQNEHCCCERRLSFFHFPFAVFHALFFQHILRRAVLFHDVFSATADKKSNSKRLVAPPTRQCYCRQCTAKKSFFFFKNDSKILNLYCEIF